MTLQQIFESKLGHSLDTNKDLFGEYLNPHTRDLFHAFKCGVEVPRKALNKPVAALFSGKANQDTWDSFKPSKEL